MTKCAVCGKRMFGGFKADNEHYCSLECYAHSPTQGFCQACLDTTSADSPGSTFTFNAVGTRMFFARDRCRQCHSIVQRKAFCVLFLPVVPLGKYRVIYTAPRQYIGRKVTTHTSVASVT